jgi:hypothetical protein
MSYYFPCIKSSHLAHNAKITLVTIYKTLPAVGTGRVDQTIALYHQKLSLKFVEHRQSLGRRSSLAD